MRLCSVGFRVLSQSLETGWEGSPGTHLGPLFSPAFPVLELTDESFMPWPHRRCPLHSGLQGCFFRNVHMREELWGVWLHCKREARVCWFRALSHPPALPALCLPTPCCVTLGLQVHKDRGPERLSLLCPPDEEFVSHGELFPGNGHPALPGRRLHLPDSIGMAVRRDWEEMQVGTAQGTG